MKKENRKRWINRVMLSGRVSALLAFASFTVAGCAADVVDRAGPDTNNLSAGESCVDVSDVVALQPGDIILNNSQSEDGCEWDPSQALTDWTDWHFCHAKLVLSVHSADEAGDASYSHHGPYRVIEADPSRGLRTPQAPYLNDAVYLSQGRIAVLRVLDSEGKPISVEQGERIARQAVAYWWSRFTFPVTFGGAPVVLPLPAMIPLPGPKVLDIDADPREEGTYCTAFVYKSVKEALGIDIADVHRKDQPLSPDRFPRSAEEFASLSAAAIRSLVLSPDEIFESKHVKKLLVSGYPDKQTRPSCLTALR